VSYHGDGVTSGRGWLTLRAGSLIVRLHLLLPALAGVAYLWRPRLAIGYLVLFATLALHELAHAAVAILLGAGRAEVQLLAYRGVAWIERLDARREAIVAAAGPVANLGAAAVAGALGAGPTLALAHAAAGDLFFTASLVMGAGNLLPVLPADGGRILRALRERAEPPPPAPDDVE